MLSAIHVAGLSVVDPDKAQQPRLIVREAVFVSFSLALVSGVVHLDPGVVLHDPDLPTRPNDAQNNGNDVLFENVER